MRGALKRGAGGLLMGPVQCSNIFKRHCVKNLEKLRELFAASVFDFCNSPGDTVLFVFVFLLLEVSSSILSHVHVQCLPLPAQTEALELHVGSAGIPGARWTQRLLHWRIHKNQ